MFYSLVLNMEIEFCFLGFFCLFLKKRQTMIQFFLECNAQTFISGVLILHSVSMSLCVCVTYLDSLESTAIAAMLSPNGGDGMIALVCAAL